ncbi:hypothetical protein BDZ91DRAFT_615368, partial [Kalaharituber pfeilii]
EFNYGCWIANMDAVTGNLKNNSYQNGLLLESGVHKLFDQYLFPISPDLSTILPLLRIIIISRRLISMTFGLDGRIPNRRCRSPADPKAEAGNNSLGTRTSRPPRLPPWHFRQSILANMRGAGEPIFEDDFPPGADMM